MSVRNGAEWWVLRIVCKRADVAAIENGGTYRGLTFAEIDAKVKVGELAYVNGELCEPVEVYDDQFSAAIRADREAARTGDQHKVTLTTEL